MIDDPTSAPGLPGGRSAARVARADTHVPTPRAAGGRLRSRPLDTGAVPARREASGPRRPGGDRRLLAVGGAFLLGLGLAAVRKRR